MMSVVARFLARVTFVACGLALAGCGAQQPQSTVSRDLNSGVTSNNGGGMAPANFGSVRVQP